MKIGRRAFLASVFLAQIAFGELAAAEESSLDFIGEGTVTTNFGQIELAYGSPSSPTARS